MSNRTLTYTIKLLSDIAKQANSDAQAVEGSNKRMASAYQKMARDADRAGQQAQRAHAQIQKAAQRTDMSLNRMGNGVGARMARQLEPAIAKLRQIQGLAEKTGNVMGKVGRGAAMGVGGAVAGGVAAAAVMQKPIAYEERVARMAITADKGNTVEGYKNVMTQIEVGVQAAYKQGGGTRDNAAAALDNMLASGQDIKSAVAALPAIMKASTASGADATELSNILIKGRQNGYIKEGQEGAFLDKSVAAGKAGQFELKDMSKWLGQQMAAGKMAGLSGEKGFDRLLMMNQAAMASAGSKDEAGNNVVNLLAKLNSKDTATDFEKQTGKDLSKYLVNSAKSGGDSVDAWVALLRDEMGKNKDYQAAQAKLKTAGTDDEKRAVNDSITNLAMGSSLGQYFQDRQAMSALIPLLTDNKSDPNSVAQQVAAALANSKGVVDSDFNKFQTTTSAKVDAAANTKDEATSKAFEGVKPAVDGVIEAFTSVGSSYPIATASVMGLGAAAAIAAAAVGGGGVIGGALDMLGNRKGKGKGSKGSKLGGVLEEVVDDVPKKKYGVPKWAPSTKTAVEAAEVMAETAASASKWSTASKLLGRAGAAGGVALGAYNAYEVLSDENSTRGQKAQGLTSAAGSAAGGWGGAAMGAAIGTAILPGVGTLLGGLIGGAAGAWGGGKAGDAAGGLARNMIDGPGSTATMSSAVQNGITAGMGPIFSTMAASMSQPPAYLNSPTLNAAPLPPQQHTFDVKDGKLTVQVQVNPSSSLIEATARASQPFIPLQLAGGGSTNPAGYGGPR